MQEMFAELARAALWAQMGIAFLSPTGEQSVHQAVVTTTPPDAR